MGKRYASRSCGPIAARLNRRDVLIGTVATTALGLSGCGGSSSAAAPVASPTVSPAPPPAPSGSGVHPIFGKSPMVRQSQALDLRLAAANFQADFSYGTQATNGDEGFYADYRASFSKALPHNSLGEVDPAAYTALLAALESGQARDFDAIPLGGTRKLANPLGAYRFTLSGLDSHKTVMRPAPAFAGLETAAEMGELYWKAMCRDVPFADYGTDPLIGAAVDDLNGFSEPVGPKVDGALTRGTIFRGDTPGDLAGPYISQLLLKTIPYGGNTAIEQRYASPAPGDDAMTDPASWLAVQNGVAPQALTLGRARYINDARALGEFVHTDFSFQAYGSAALILLAIPNSLDIANSYNTSATQGGFVSLGGPDVLDMVAKAANLSLTGAWYQKWLVHRRARPESYGGRLQTQIAGVKTYGLPDEIVSCDGVARTMAATGHAFLPQAFAEGSPTHPSYPAGHATVAGACATVLKAFFEESRPVPAPVVASRDGQSLEPYSGTLTIGGEIDKLANNVALGRDWAGVHYRSDGTEGLITGEQQALGLLADYSRTYAEEFDGFNLTLFDGRRVVVRDGLII